jgi:hypothetical protein
MRLLNIIALQSHLILAESRRCRRAGVKYKVEPDEAKVKLVWNGKGRAMMRMTVEYRPRPLS